LFFESFVLKWSVRPRVRLSSHIECSTLFTALDRHRRGWRCKLNKQKNSYCSVLLFLYKTYEADSVRYSFFCNASHAFLANINSICCRPSVVCLSVCLSVMFMRPTQPVAFSAFFLRHLVSWPSIDIHGKFYVDRPRETLPSGEG